MTNSGDVVKACAAWATTAAYRLASAAPAHGHMATPSCAGVHVAAAACGWNERPSRVVQRRSGKTDCNASTTASALAFDGSGPR